jgi:hypothetical protein
VGRHQDKHILQEDEGVVDGQGQETCSQTPSCEEVGWYNHSNLAVLVNSEQKSVEGLLCLFNLQNIESSIDGRYQNHRQHNVDHEHHVREQQSSFTSACRVISFKDLHHGEESRVEVNEHVVSDISVELELDHASLRPQFRPDSSNIDFIQDEDRDVSDYQYRQNNYVEEECLEQTTN